MKIMNLKVIESISFAKLTNAYHVSFLANVKADIEKYGAEDLGLDATLYGSFCSFLETEQDIVNRARASAYTRQLAEHDQTRDNYFRRIYYKLKNAENDSMNENITPELIATINAHFLSQYPISITKDANQVETAKLRGFIKDLRQFLLDSFEVLQITSDIAILETANDTYEELYMARIREKSESMVSTECRANTEAAFLQISYTLAATANMVSTDVDQMMKISRCANVIDEINVLIRDFKSKAYRNGNDNENDDDNDNENPDVE